MVKLFASHRPKPARPGAAAPPAAARESVKPMARTARNAEKPKEIGGPSGPEPTRYGDWERNGICVDF